jgi:hypothetical protein
MLDLYTIDLLKYFRRLIASGGYARHYPRAEVVSSAP